MLAFGVWALIANSTVGICSYQQYARVRFILNVPFVVAAFICVWAFARGDIFLNDATTTLAPWPVAGIIFWVLFPPIWFFTEYLAAHNGAFTGASLSDLKTFADFASKVWAAFLVIYTFGVTQQIKIQEEAIKAKQAVVQQATPTAKGP